MRRFLRAESGAGAAEFALILPVLMFLLFGAFNLFLLVYAQANLHAATEATARYWSVTTAATGTAPTPSALTTFAAGQYKGPSISASYAYPTSTSVVSATGGCGSGGNTGHTVNGSGTYLLNYGFGHISIPLRAAACFP